MENSTRVLPFVETIFCELVAYREGMDGYDKYVFRNLITGEYIMVTGLPNWNLPFIEVGDRGFMKYQEALAGVDSWYDREQDKYVPYKSDNSYILDWVREYKQNNL